MESWKKSLYAMWFAQFSAMSAISSLIAFIPLYVRLLGAESLEEAAIWSGIIIGIAPLFASLGGPLWGLLSDRFGRKPMVMRVMFANTFVLTSMGFVHSLIQLAALRILQGTFGGIGAPAMALVSTLAPKEQLAYAMGIFQSAVIVGAALGPLMGGLLADTFGYHSVFWALGVFSLLAGLTVLFFVEERKQPSLAKKKVSTSELFASLMHNKNLLKMCFILFICNFGIMVVSPIIPIYLTDLGAPEDNLATLAGAIVAIAGLSSAATSAVAGRLLKRWSFHSILYMACFLAGLTFIGMTLSTTLPELFLFRSLTGLFIGAMLPTANAFIALIIPEHQRGTAYGVTNSANLMGIVIGPIFGGVMTSLLGIHSVFWASALAMIIAAFWIYGYVKNPVSH